MHPLSKSFLFHPWRSASTPPITITDYAPPSPSLSLKERKKMATFFLLLFFYLLTSSAVAVDRSEIDSLTAFKLNLVDPLGSLSNWSPSTPAAPCDWHGVLCSSGGHVTKLLLSNLNLSGHVTDLHSLTSLQTLTLASNSFSGPIPSLPPTLRSLDLSSNHLQSSIPPSLGLLQNLQILNLSYNRLFGTLPASISNCSSLVQLSLDFNQLAGVLPAAIPALPRLQVISLSGNNLSGSIPPSVFCNVSGSAPSLKVVRLGFNAFTAIDSPPERGSCSSVLQVLDLQQNRIRGEFPVWLSNLASELAVLDVSGNFISGSIPVEIGSFRNLTELRLANNSLSSVLPAELKNCNALQILDLQGNQISGEIPLFLGEMKGLKALSLGRNRFSGSFPSSLGNLTQLEALDLSNIGLAGSIPSEILKLTNLTSLSLSGNRLSGRIPDSIGDLNQLVSLNLSGNEFSSEVPATLGSLYKLTTLDLSKQRLSGELPSELSGLPDLQVLALQENYLTGEVPVGFSSLLGLSYLNLSSNNFTGHIPPTFGFLSNLAVLSLSNNNISGSVPPELGNCSNLQILELQDNSITGDVPPDFARLLNLTKLDLGGNNLSGQIPRELSHCSALNILLLDDNHISGVIPSSLSNLSSLTDLDLSGNNLTGEIPADFTNLSHLAYFNVSNNRLQGEIPSGLGSRFSSPSIYADNGNLCGSPLNRECEEDFDKEARKKRLIWLLVFTIGGACLLTLCCCFYTFTLLRWWRKRLKEGSVSEKKHSSPSRSRPSSGSTALRSSDSNGAPKLVMFNNKITLSETIDATRNFDEENVLSRTKHGLLFKASYSDGMVLAIRRLPDGLIDETAFKKEAEALGRIKHRNVIVLRGYYAGPPDLRLLVYDYMPNGTLATLLQEASHQDGHVLNWPMRHLIALGIARGLSFLHTSEVLHGDVKPQNVLFDADFEAHLSDFGLDRLVVTNSEPSRSSSVGTLGYVSPESAVTGLVSQESDVYSFGIVLLELLTGKRPVMFTQDEDIVKWVKRQLQKGQITELLEPGLLELDPESSEWEEFLLGIKVGLLCTAPDPSDRPTMADVVFMLEGCRVGPDIPSSADPTSHHSPV